MTFAHNDNCPCCEVGRKRVAKLEHKLADLERTAACAEVMRDKSDARVRELETALIWCSGSPDFNEGGQARAGWLKLCAPLLKNVAPDFASVEQWPPAVGEEVYDPQIGRRFVGIVESTKPFVVRWPNGSRSMPGDDEPRIVERLHRPRAARACPPVGATEARPSERIEADTTSKAETCSCGFEESYRLVEKHGLFTENLRRLQDALCLREGKHTADSVARIAIERITRANSIAEQQARIASGQEQRHSEAKPPWCAMTSSDPRVCTVERAVSPPERINGKTYVSDVICEVYPTEARYGEGAMTAFENAAKIASALAAYDKSLATEVWSRTDNPRFDIEGDRPRNPSSWRAVGPWRSDPVCLDCVDLRARIAELEGLLDEAADWIATGSLANGREGETENGECVQNCDALGITCPNRPLTGDDLAEKHGFEPIPDHLKDPFVRPMRIMVDGYAPAGKEPNNRAVEIGQRTAEPWGADIVAARDALGLPTPPEQRTDNPRNAETYVKKCTACGDVKGLSATGQCYGGRSHQWDFVLAVTP
jgi:hypothetical protein